MNVPVKLAIRKGVQQAGATLVSVPSFRVHWVVPSGMHPAARFLDMYWCCRSGHWHLRSAPAQGGGNQQCARTSTTGRPRRRGAPVFAAAAGSRRGVQGCRQAAFAATAPPHQTSSPNTTGHSSGGRRCGGAPVFAAAAGSRGENAHRFPSPLSVVPVYDSLPIRLNVCLVLLSCVIVFGDCSVLQEGTLL
jgi:hypothetical protein